MNINMNYLIQHVSCELHTMIKIWKDNLSPDIKPDIICTRNDLKDEYLLILSLQKISLSLLPVPLFSQLFPAKNSLFMHIFLSKINTC